MRSLGVFFAVVAILGMATYSASEEKQERFVVDRFTAGVDEKGIPKGWSQEKLAEEAGLHRTYIGQVERGEKSIGIGNLFRIAAALGFPASKLVDV